MTNIDAKLDPDDPQYVMRTGEGAYQRNKAAWDTKYAGQYIGIHRGKVVDSDRDKSELVKRILAMQEEKGQFRAYIVEIGAPLLKARGPRIILKVKKH